MANQFFDIAHALLYLRVVNLVEGQTAQIGIATIGPGAGVKLGNQGRQGGRTDKGIGVTVVDGGPLAGDVVVGPTIGRIEHGQQFCPAHFFAATFLLNGLQPALPDSHNDRGQGRGGTVGQVKNLATRLEIDQGQPVTDRGGVNGRPGYIDVVGGDDGVDNTLSNLARGAGFTLDADGLLAVSQWLAGERIITVNVGLVK